MSTTPANPDHSGRSLEPPTDQRPEIEVLFHLSGIAGWPPYPAEAVTARLLDGDRAQLTGIPMYADGLSAGDIVQIDHDGAGFVGREVVTRGRHTTLRVVATDVEQLRAVSSALISTGARTMLSEQPSVLAVDVPPRGSLEHVLVLLDEHSSRTLTYVVSCRQHRMTPPQDDFTVEAELALCPPEGSLDAALRGRVVRPADDDWDTARAAWNLAVDQHPALVVEVADAFDVQAVIHYAKEHGLRVAPQSTGHNASPLTDLRETILLRTGSMRAIDVDVAARSVRVEAGAIWSEVTAALAPHGLAALAGSSPDVGVAGYALGGGYSWLGRRHGLASSSITAVELVTGNGDFHRVDADTEPDLFWAVRGGGANVGVVCAMELDVLPIPDVYAGAMLFPLDRAAEILPAYARWTDGLDEAVTSCIRLLRLPPLPELPEPLRGNAFVMIDGAVDAPAEEAARLLAPLRELGPLMDTFARMPTSQLSAIHMDPPAPVPGIGDGISLADLTPEAIEVLLAHAGPGVQSALLAVDIRHAGGAMGRPDPRGGVVDHLLGRFLVFAVGVPVTPEMGVALTREVSSIVAALEPWAAERDYLNFREVAVPADRLFEPGALATLRAVRADHDPAGILLAGHTIG